MMYELGARHDSNPTVDKNLVFEWRRVEERAHYPPSFEPCATDLGISQFQKLKYLQLLSYLTTHCMLTEMVPYIFFSHFQISFS